MSIFDDNMSDLDEDDDYPTCIGRPNYLDDRPTLQAVDRPDRAVDAMSGPLNHWKHSDAFKDQLGQA